MIIPCIHAYIKNQLTCNSHEEYRVNQSGKGISDIGEGIAFFSEGFPDKYKQYKWEQPHVTPLI